MPSTCTFFFDRPEPVYYSGEVVNGRVELKTASQSNVEAIVIKITGFANVLWEEEKRVHDSKTDTYKTDVETFKGSDTFLKSKIDVPNYTTTELPAGTHTFDFNFTLPYECPSTCCQECGSIEYQLKLKVKRKFAFDDNFTQPLTVKYRRDLNLKPDCALPVQLEEVKYFCCWPCSSGPVLFTLTFPYSGYTPGQNIEFQLEVDNQSQYEVCGYELHLWQYYTFKASSPHYNTEKRKHKLRGTENNTKCLRLSKRIYKGHLSLTGLDIPATWDSEGIINVYYKLVMTIWTPCGHTDEELKVPITIGVVPLKESLMNEAEEEIESADENRVEDTENENKKDLPPSFVEATAGGPATHTTGTQKARYGWIGMTESPTCTEAPAPSAPPLNMVQSEEKIPLNKPH